MATVFEEQPQHDRRFHERRRNWSTSLSRADGLKVSWGGIWGGVLVAVGLLMLLTALGIAIGISAVDPGETAAGAVGTGAVIWGSVSLLLALFVGGMVATRGGAITDRATALFEGSLVWVVALLIMVYLAGSGVSMLAGGAFQVVGGATQAIGTAVQMRAEPTVDFSGTADEVSARLRDPATAQRIANVTGLAASEVAAVLESTAEQVDANRDDPAAVAGAARDGIGQLMDRAAASGTLERRAEAMQPEASAAAWITFAALVLSLLAAVMGAMLGRRRGLPATTNGRATIV